MEEIKKIIAKLMQEFATEEVGNKVTSNNMMGLHVKINMVLDGEITLSPPKEKAPAKKEK